MGNLSQSIRPVIISILTLSVIKYNHSNLFSVVLSFMMRSVSWFVSVIRKGLAAIGWLKKVASENSLKSPFPF